MRRRRRRRRRRRKTRKRMETTTTTTTKKATTKRWDNEKGETAVLGSRGAPLGGLWEAVLKPLGG
eukprot:6582979-Pyramimonas_sp.AAC.1